VIRAPKPDEFAALSDLCLRSKAYWGYDDAFMAACRDELTVTPEDIEDGDFGVLDVDGSIAGVVYVTCTDDVADLDLLYVDPAFMGAGYGVRLFQWALDVARRRGANRITIDADPNAKSFYEHMGARLIGESPSGSIPGRLLPLLEYHL